MDIVVVLIILALVGFLLWQFNQTKNALATTRVQSRHSPQQTTEIVNSAFRGVRAALWTDEHGPGTINKRRRGKDNGITMSITVEPTAGGATNVEMWASQYNQYFLVFANFAGSVNGRKKAIARALA